MIASVGFTLSGLIFTLLIAIIYFSKKRYVEVEHKLYGFLLLLTIFLLLLELYCVFTMRFRNLHPVLNEILCRLYVLGATTWIISIVIYVITLNKQEKYTNMSDLFKDPINNIMVVFGIVMFVISCFRSLTYTSGVNNELFVIGGDAIKTLYIVSIGVGAFLFYILIRNKNKVSLFKRSPIIFFIIFYLVMFVIQYFYTDFNDLTFMFALIVVAMYFTIVSQDYKLVTDLEVAKEEAEAANKDKTEFLSKMSHQIRTPMNAIMGFSGSLMNDKELNKEKVLEDARNINVASTNLLSTINNILDISKIESGKEKVQDARFYIADVIYDLQQYAEAKINKENVMFSVDFDENTPRELLGDKQKIFKILFNILNNSIKYTTSGEIKLKEECLVDRGFAYLKYTISDTGIGIEENDFDKIYLKFSGLETDTKDIEHGAGLGLSITKALVDMLGGKISFTSNYNVGTTFVVELKNRIVDYHKCGNIISRKDVLNAIEPKLDCKGKKIIIVDDNKLNLKNIYNLLREYNFDITIVESGSSCIELMKKNEKYDLILIDYLMPDLDGIQTINKMKEITSDLPPVIVTTANINSDIKERFIKEGFAGYLSKPVDSKRLRSIVEYYFKK